MKKSIFTKVFVSYFLIILLLVGLILTFSFQTIRNHYIETLESNLENLAVSLKTKVVSYLEAREYQPLDQFVKDLGKDIQTRITVIGEDGTVWADSEEDPKVMENHKTRPEIYQAFQSQVGTSIRLSSTVKAEMLYVAIPVAQGGEVTDVIRVSLFLKDINSLLQELKANILKVSFVIILLALFVAFMLTRSFSRPIKELSLAAKRVSLGEYDTKVFLKNQDELRELADSFNDMTDQVKNSFTQISTQKEELNGIIASMKEGLLLLDKEGNVLLRNESFERLIAEEVTKGVFYGEVIKDSSFAALIKKVQQEKQNFTEEVALNEKFFLCSGSFLPSREEMILIFHDITEIKEVEKIKRDFVVNVSHELRTPLTSIKGYLETIEDDVQDEQKRYVEIMKRNTERLIHIVEDLLLLSELEEKSIQTKTENLNLASILKDVVQTFEKRFKEKGIDIRTNFEEPLPSIQVDPFMVEQVFVNLIDNGLKYTEKGELTLTLRKEGSELLAEVKDSGIGISAEYLPRIFERFYVVDKSRSRKVGGTGLGLSLVKHIVALHNGSIDVESEPSIGTTFTLHFPISSAVPTS